MPRRVSTRFPRNQLDAFRATYAHGAITRAADVLGVSQPAVTKLVAALELELGFKLFQRGIGGMTPTPEAHEFADAVERFYFGLERLARSADDIAGMRRGQVRLAAMPAVATDLLPGVLASVKRTHAGIRLLLDVHTSPRVVDLVAAGAFDIGFAHLPERRADIDIVATCDMACVVAMAPDHPLAAKDTIRPPDLEGVPMVLLSHHTVTARHVEHMLLAHDVGIEIVLECQPSFVACAAVARGLGVTIVDPMTPAMIGNVVITRPFLPRIPFQFRMIRPSGVPPSRAAKEVTDSVLAHIANSRWIELNCQ